jgi:hypothetical protein
MLLFAPLVAPPSAVSAALAVVWPVPPFAMATVPENDPAAIAVLQVNPVPLVQVSALDAELHEGIAKAVGDAVDAVPFANTVLAACVARSPTVTRPVAVRAPVIVGLAIVGDVDSTTLPLPVDEDAPVPPLAADSGVWRVMLPNVGDGYVCPRADSETSPETSIASNFFIFRQ